MSSAAWLDEITEVETFFFSGCIQKMFLGSRYSKSSKTAAMSRSLIGLSAADIALLRC